MERRLPAGHFTKEDLEAAEEFVPDLRKAARRFLPTRGGQPGQAIPNGSCGLSKEGGHTSSAQRVITASTEKGQRRPVLGLVAPRCRCRSSLRTFTACGRTDDGADPRRRPGLLRGERPRDPFGHRTARGVGDAEEQDVPRDESPEGGRPPDHPLGRNSCTSFIDPDANPGDLLCALDVDPVDPDGRRSEEFPGPGLLFGSTRIGSTPARKEAVHDLPGNRRASSACGQPVK